MLSPSMRATACSVSKATAVQGMVEEQIFRLEGEWEFQSGSISGVEEAWLPSRQGEWEAVILPHCFNALDACDPDKTYFRGHGWYRRRLVVRNAYANGRTILHFQGAGQTTTLWIGSTRVGTHIGGYDEFAFDITDAITQLTACRARRRRADGRALR